LRHLFGVCRRTGGSKQYGCFRSEMIPFSRQPEVLDKYPRLSIKVRKGIWI